MLYHSNKTLTPHHALLLFLKKAKPLGLLPSTAHPSSCDCVQACANTFMGVNYHNTGIMQQATPSHTLCYHTHPFSGPAADFKTSATAATEATSPKSNRRVTAHKA